MDDRISCSHDGRYVVNFLIDVTEHLWLSTKHCANAVVIA